MGVHVAKVTHAVISSDVFLMVQLLYSRKKGLKKLQRNEREKSQPTKNEKKIRIKFVNISWM